MNTTANGVVDTVSTVSDTDYYNDDDDDGGGDGTDDKADRPAFTVDHVDAFICTSRVIRVASAMSRDSPFTRHLT